MPAPNQPSLTLSEFFPHELIRAGQDKLVQDLDKTFTDKKILLAHAPTGLGKTACALSVAVYHALQHKKKVFFLTNRHTQHQIAIETLKLIQQKIGQEIKCADLIGKRWMCSQEIANLFGNDFNEFCKAVVQRGECEFYNKVREKKALTVEAKVLLSELSGARHNEEVMARSKEKRMCGYEISLALAKKATVIIGDYYYLFNPRVQDALFTKLEWALDDLIVIVDEGHNLPSRIAEMLSTNLTSFMIRNAIIEAKKHNYGGLVHWLQELNTIVMNLADFKGREKEKFVSKEQFITLLAKAVKYDDLLNELEVAADEVRKKQRKSYLGGIAAFLDAWKGEDEGFTRILAEKTGKAGPYLCLSYICLDAALITKRIFSSIHSGVIMSGTLKPTFMYKDVLGIETEKGMEQEYSSPFPPENKLSLIVPETTTKYSLRGEAMYKKIAEKCSEISMLIPGNVALFFPSYQLRDLISSSLSVQKKLFWEKPDWSKEEKEIFLAEFKSTSKAGGILLGVSGGSFAEGIDYPGDLLNGVIVVGLPLAKPNLHTQEIIKHYDTKFGQGWDYGYIYPAINKCLQSSGRCIRSETDKGAVIYLDERFAWQNYFICFPKEGLVVSREYGKLLKEFFEKRKITQNTDSAPIGRG